MKAWICLACVLVLSVTCCGCGGAGGNFVEVESKAQFQLMVLESQRPVMVEFYRNGCVACLSENPKLASVSQAYADRAGFVKIDRSVTEVRQQYEVVLYPTVIVFHKGKEFRRVSGQLPQSAYAEMIDVGLSSGFRQ